MGRAPGSAIIAQADARHTFYELVTPGLSRTLFDNATVNYGAGQAANLVVAMVTWRFGLEWSDEPPDFFQVLRVPMTCRVKKTSTEITREIILQEVKDALPLYEWLCAHISKEFKVGPIRVGGVDGLRPFTDKRLRNCCRSSGLGNCKEAGAWCRRLARMGLITCPSLDGRSYLILVIGSNGQFKEEPEDLPPYFLPAVKLALKHLGRRGSIWDTLATVM